jgi:hypothetical protein
MISRTSWRLSAAVVTLWVASGCSSGVSNCKRNSSDNLRSTKKSMQSWDLIGTVMDVATLPVTTVAGCATDLAVSPVYEAAEKIRMRSIKAERVSADDPRVSQSAVPIASLKIEALPSTPPAPAAQPPKCKYRTNCVAASTLLISPGKGAGGRIVISQEHQQYELTNNCGEHVECFVCGSKGGKVSRAAGTGPCDDAASRPLEGGETWIGDGSAENVDGMALSCLPFDGGGTPPGCKTWPD